MTRDREMGKTYPCMQVDETRLTKGNVPVPATSYRKKGAGERKALMRGGMREFQIHILRRFQEKVGVFYFISLN
jgi:hypothetical protein